MTDEVVKAAESAVNTAVVTEAEKVAEKAVTDVKSEAGAVETKGLNEAHSLIAELEAKVKAAEAWVKRIAEHLGFTHV